MLRLGVLAYSCNPSYWEAVVWKRSARQLQIRSFHELSKVRYTFLELCRNTDGGAKSSASGGGGGGGGWVMRSPTTQSQVRRLKMKCVSWKDSGNYCESRWQFEKTNPQAASELTILRHSCGRLGRVGRRRRSTTQPLFTLLVSCFSFHCHCPIWNEFPVFIFALYVVMCK